MALLVIFSGATVEAGLDLTASANEYVAEGMKHQQLSFRDDKRRVEYEPPQGWTFAGSANQLRLTAPKSFAEAMVIVAPLSKPQPLDENAMKAFGQQLLTQLPVGSQFAKVEQEMANPVLIGGNESFEVTVSYQLMGETFFRSALLVNLKDSQLQFRLTAKKIDFPGLHREFKASLMTWQWVEQNDVASVQ